MGWRGEHSEIYLRVQRVDDAVRPCSLALIPDELKVQTICKKSVKDDPESLEYILRGRRCAALPCAGNHTP